MISLENNSATTHKQKTKYNWYISCISIVMLFVLISIWSSFYAVMRAERKVTLEQTQNHLKMAVSTLADLNYLSDKNKNMASKNMEYQDTIWRVFLLYPDINIWVESQGTILAGSPTPNNLDTFVYVQDTKGVFTVHATLPIKTILTNWQRNVWQSCIILSIITVIFIVLILLLSKTLRQRIAAEEKTQQAYISLEKELTERKISQEILREHDALLDAITKIAAYLLEAQNRDEAISAALDLIAKAVNVNRIQLSSMTFMDGSFQSIISHEWCSSGMDKIMDNETLKKLDLACQIYQIKGIDLKNVAKPTYKMISLPIDEFPDLYKDQLNKMKMQSFLCLPVLVDNKFWGNLIFIDSNPVKRQWSWAEIDSLTMLSNLIGASILQTRFIEELNLANRRSGMAEIATNILHNVGNVLNSVNVSAGLLITNMRQSHIKNFGNAVELIREHEKDLSEFISMDARGKHLPAYLIQLHKDMLLEKDKNLEELNLIINSIDHIKEIVSMQQNYARYGNVKEKVDIKSILNDSLRMSIGSTNRQEINVINEFIDTPFITIDKHNLLQILINLINNAKHACDESNKKTNKKIIIRVETEDAYMKISIIDNGIGIDKKNLTQIFSYGFTTRKTGHGFGLHNCALSAKEMGGQLIVSSDGIECGATFTLKLPLDPIPATT